MNPLPNEWAIKHRADACASTHRPFAPGEYFYTLLFRDADGYRREDLSEEAWLNHFHFGKHATNLCRRRRLSLWQKKMPSNFSGA
jgi:hypothetical protein